MYKKVIAIIMLCAMFVSFSPAVAAEDTSPKPTIEEILNDYHQMASERRYSRETDTVAAYSRFPNSQVKTLEQETVDRLTTAGYEAFNVTTSNYSSLEAELNTDFASMGMNPGGSYIVVISGEEDSSNTNHRSSGIGLFARVLDDEYGGGSIGDTPFTHTYNGKTYTMRYVTITAAENDELGLVSAPIELLDKCNIGKFLNDLEIPIAILSSFESLSGVGTLYSLMTAILPDDSSARTESLVYTGSSNWTVTYAQVYDSAEGKWKLGASYECVRMHYSIKYEYYEPSTNQYKTRLTQGYYPYFYSEIYGNNTLLKDRAAQAFEFDTYWLDEIPYVEYKFNGKSIIKHYRGFWELNYEYW